MTNILILSVGTRDLVVRAFKKELAGRGRVVATDASSVAPALYDADAAYIVPRIDAPDYLDRILDICRKEHITGLFSLIDPELSLIAKNRDRFTAIGVTPVVSSYELCELTLNKYQMYQRLLSMGIPTQKCWMDPDAFLQDMNAGAVSFPVFVKPQGGSASIHITEVRDEQMLRALKADEPDLMIQELMRGQEYGCDVYVDLLSHKVTGIFLKKKIKMRAGETDKAVSVKDQELLGQIAAFAESLGFAGMIDMDLFHDEEKTEDDRINNPEGTWYLSEINPRFGGGYPHAYACGVNFPARVIENLEGRAGTPAIGSYETGIYMMKYNETAIRKKEELVH